MVVNPALPCTVPTRDLHSRAPSLFFFQSRCNRWSGELDGAAIASNDACSPEDARGEADGVVGQLPLATSSARELVHAMLQRAHAYAAS